MTDADRTVAHQLDLFHGPHVPLVRCLAALEDGDVARAAAALGDAPADTGASAARRHLQRLAAALPPLGAHSGLSARQVHDAFVAALSSGGMEPACCPIPLERWFRVYARFIARALDASAPGRSFRGWHPVDFLLGAGDIDAALASARRLVATAPTGPAWIEAARAAWAVGDRDLTESWLVQACLESREALGPAPPRIEATGIATLDPPRDLLPRFSVDIEDLWTETEELALPEPASQWVPSVGVIDGVLSPLLFGAPMAPPDGREPAPSRAFFNALLAARRARTTSPLSAIQRGEGEAEPRGRMRRLAPALLARYLARLEGIVVRASGARR